MTLFFIRFLRSIVHSLRKNNNLHRKATVYYSDSALESAISQYKHEYWNFVTLTLVFGLEGSYMLVYSSLA